MGDRSWHKLTIGGTVQRSWLAQWLDENYGESLEGAEQNTSEEGAYFDDDGERRVFLYVVDPETSDMNTSALREQGIPYNLIWDACAGSYDAGGCYWRPGMAEERSYTRLDGSDEPAIPYSEVLKLVAAATSLEEFAEQFKVRHPPIPELPPLVLVDEPVTDHA